MIIYKVKCDGCETIVDIKEGVAHEGWAVISFPKSETQFTYCPECWAIMFASLIRPQEPKAWPTDAGTGAGKSK